MPPKHRWTGQKNIGNIEPDEAAPWPDGLSIPKTVLCVKPGKSCTVNVEVTNMSKSDISLQGRTVLGRLEPVRSVTPLEVKLVQKEEKCQSDAEGPEEYINVPKMSEPSVSQPMPKREQFMPDVDLSELTEEQQKSAKNMLINECDSFAKDDEVGCIKDMVMDIKLKDHQPVQKNYLSIPRPLYAEVKQYVEDLLNQQFITKSKSPYNSNVVCARKRDSTIRLYIDCRSLNDKTIDDRHPLPRMQESLDSLGGNSWFSVLDQGKAYHHGFISEDSHHLTFITLWGLYQWIWAPFGLKNAPAEFQRTMENILVEYRDKIVIPYLDDLIVFSKSFEEHLEHLKLVLRRLKEHGVKLKGAQMQLFQTQSEILGCYCFSTWLSDGPR